LSNCESWLSLANIKYVDIIKLGPNFCVVEADKIRNPFWKNVLQSWSEFCNKLEISNLESILFSPLWYNGNFNNKNLFFKSWYNKNIINIIDLISPEGVFYTFEQLKTIYNIHGTYLDYNRIIVNIPQEWKTIIRNNIQLILSYKQNISLSPYVKVLLKDLKGSKLFYEVISDANKIVTPVKWNNHLGVINEEECKQIYKRLNTIKEVKLKDFQFKLNNKILITKSLLFKIGKIDNNLCSYCNNTAETVTHLFLDCRYVNEFVTIVKNWLKDQCDIDLSPLSKHFIFSIDGKTLTGNYVSLLIKYYIYKSKFKENNRNSLTLPPFKAYIKQKLTTMKYISFINDKNDLFQKYFENIMVKTQ
jgi:hypothetical protein